MRELDGRMVLVTGASSGIGEGTARELAAAGARVACVARRKERIESLAKEIGGFAVEADVADEAAARRAVNEAADSSGGLDAVLNIAGVQLLAPFSDGRSDEWRTLLDVNIFGACVVTHQALGYLREAGGGDIVNMSSIAGRRVTGSDGAVYSGIKFTVHAISEAIRRELHGEGIRVMIVSPGPRTLSSDRTWPTRRSGPAPEAAGGDRPGPQRGRTPDRTRPRPAAAPHAARDRHHVHRRRLMETLVVRRRTGRYATSRCRNARAATRTNTAR